MAHAVPERKEAAMNFRKGKGRDDPEINLIPFIDVLLVILIFLMITTTYSRFTELQITLPTADADKAQERPAQINVGIDAEGNYALNNERVSAQDAAELAEELKNVVGRKNESGKDPVVIINADQAVAHQKVINVLQAARMAGLEKVTFAAQASGKK
jgi:biopolymer transport protein ExbD